MRWIIATHNAHKAEEFKRKLSRSIELVTLKEMLYTEDIPEIGSTLEENARIKAETIWRRFGLSCFADDTGLEVEALHGAPGVYSARYAGEASNDQANMTLLLENMRGVRNRKARFVTKIAIVYAGDTHMVEGVLNGHILEVQKGNQGFGYDPIFCPDGDERSLAEYSIEEKNSISHRGKAADALAAFINSLHS